MLFTLHSVIFSGALPSQVDDLAVGLPQSSPEQSRRAGQQPQEVEVRGQHELPQGLHTEERGAEGVRGEEGRARGRRGESGARRARGRQDELLRLFDDSGGAEDDNETSERRGRGRRHAFFLEHGGDRQDAASSRPSPDQSRCVQLRQRRRNKIFTAAGEDLTLLYLFG